MKITIDYNVRETEHALVDDAGDIGDYAIRIKFTDGAENLIDFKPFLMKTQHPSIQKYLNESFFLNFKLLTET